MNRREAIILFGKTFLLASVFPAKFLQARMKSFSKQAEERLVLIHDSSQSSVDYRLLLKQASPYLTARDNHWNAKLVIWDIQKNENEIEAFIQKYGANTQTTSFPVLISVPETNEQDFEVEVWSLDWLEQASALDLDGCYPISGGWWSVDGDWHPTDKKVRNHLFKSPNHTKGKFQMPWLETLKLAELQSLHSDHHREMIKKGKVHWKNVNVECPVPAF